MDCRYCGKEINNKGSLVSHEMVCKLNPEATKHAHSVLLGFKPDNIPWNAGQVVGRLPHWDIKYPDSVVFCENSTYHRNGVKKRIITQGLKEYVCEICNIGPIWNNKPMPLILDHINGINNDNRLHNLRFVCSNCDSQLETYKSKNRKK